MPAPPPVISTVGLRRTFTVKPGRTRKSGKPGSADKPGRAGKSAAQAPVEAVRGLDLTVRAGEIVGFLGPNGAGKTTTLRMLTTLLPPSGGQAVVVGHDLLKEPARVRARIGYVSQAGGMDPACSVREELVTQGRLYRLGARDAVARAHELAADLGLEELLDRPTAALSGGQRRRLEIGAGLVHRPEVLFLDEPTTGLDPRGRSELWDLVRRVRAEHGTTVFLTTHYLDEADALADRVVIVDHGSVVAEGTPAALKAEHAGSPGASLQDAFLAITGRTAQSPDQAPVAV